jgi:hypothetical protein
LNRFGRASDSSAQALSSDPPGKNWQTGGSLKPSVFYRIAAVLMLLFDVGHTVGFWQSDPKWGVETLIGSMRSIHFDYQGFNRTYWDFFVGFGLMLTVFLLFAALLAWQLGGLPAETLALRRGTVWSLALCFLAVTILSWRYFFIAPLVFSIAITVFDCGGAALGEAQCRPLTGLEITSLRKRTSHRRALWIVEDALRA